MIQDLLMSLTPMHVIVGVAAAVGLYYAVRASIAGVRADLRAMDDKLTGIVSRNIEADRRLEGHETKTNARLGAVEAKTAGHEAMIARLDERSNSILTGLGEIKGAISRIDGRQ